MFGRKCPQCSKKVSKEFEFCPYCGNVLREENRGLLDDIKEIESMDINSSDIEDLTRDIGKQMGFGFIDTFPFNTIVKKLSRDIEKQFKDIDREFAAKKTSGKEQVVRENGAEIKKTTFPGGFSVQIKMGGSPESIPVQIRDFNVREEHTKDIKFNELNREKISKLPRREPEARVRRLTDKITYEILLPGVKSMRNVSVNKLENSIEIKAITKNEAYFKLIPVALPLKKYYLKKEKLIIELSPEQ
ncbi:MAG: zinc ribbon domain-containing protein [archaeon]